MAVFSWGESRLLYHGQLTSHRMCQDAHVEPLTDQRRLNQGDFSKVIPLSLPGGWEMTPVSIKTVGRTRKRRVNSVSGLHLGMGQYL